MKMMMMMYVTLVRQIKNKMDLSKFPFDSDVIEFEMGSKFMGSKKLVFQLDPVFDHLKTVVSEGVTEILRDPAIRGCLAQAADLVLYIQAVHQ
jgi:hypothetical protein